MFQGLDPSQLGTPNLARKEMVVVQFTSFSDGAILFVCSTCKCRCVYSVWMDVVLFVWSVVVVGYPVVGCIALCTRSLYHFK